MRAGAHAVVSTFWSVDDEHAARIMQDFAGAYRPGYTDPISPLCEVRRKLIRENVDLRIWAAYTLTLGEL